MGALCSAEGALCSTDEESMDKCSSFKGHSQDRTATKPQTRPSVVSEDTQSCRTVPPRPPRRLARDSSVDEASCSNREESAVPEPCLPPIPQGWMGAGNNNSPQARKRGRPGATERLQNEARSFSTMGGNWKEAQVVRTSEQQLRTGRGRSPLEYDLSFTLLCGVHDPGSPLSLLRGNVNILSELLNRAFRQPAQETDLVDAVKHNRLRQLHAKLHLTDVDVSTQEDADGVTAVYWAVCKDHREALELLLRCGAQPKKANRDGRNPVECAASRGVQLMLQYSDGMRKDLKREVKKAEAANRSIKSQLENASQKELIPKRARARGNLHC